MSPPCDRSRFEFEVVTTLDRLYGAALRLAKNPADAEDLVAEAVAKAWASLDSLGDPARFQGWIFRILTNTFIGECRKRGTVSLDEPAGEEEEFSLFEHLHQPFLLWWGTPEQEFLNKVLREDLQSALEALPRGVQDGRGAERARGLQLSGDRRHARDPHRHRTLPAGARPVAAPAGGLASLGGRSDWRREGTGVGGRR